MAFNGAGTFNRLYSWATDKLNSIKVRADRMDAEMDGFATGLSNCVTKDGQTTITANISLNSNRLTSVANGTAAQDALTVAQYQGGAPTYNSTPGGTADAITFNLSPTLGGYVTGMTVRFTPASNNTGSANVAINGLAAKTVKIGAANLSANDIVANVPVELVYDGTNFQLHAPVGSRLASLTLPVPVASGGTGGATAAAGRAGLATPFSNYTELGGNVTVNSSYVGAHLYFNATSTVTFDTAANLTANFAMAVTAGAGATVTLDGNTTEPVDGATTRIVAANTSAIVTSTGNATYGLRTNMGALPPGSNGTSLIVTSGNATFGSVYTKAQTGQPTVLTPVNGTLTIDWGAINQTATANISVNTTIAYANLANITGNQVLTLDLLTGAANCTLSWPNTTYFPSNTTTTLSTSNATYDRINMIADATRVRVNSHLKGYVG